MSKRRNPGEIVIRAAGSGFIGSHDPKYIQVPDEPEYTNEVAPCMVNCGDDYCREWANLKVVLAKETGFLFHVSECQMQDYNND